MVAAALLVATAGRLAVRPEDWLLIVSVAAAAILALEFPLQISLSEKVSVATAVFFAAVLLLPVSQAAALIGAVQAADICLVAYRKVRATRERAPMRAILISVLFNGGQAYLSTLAAGLVLLLAGVSLRAGTVGVESVLVIAAAAAVMYAANILLVAVAIAIATRRSPIAIFLGTQRLVYVQFGTLYLVGVLAAIAAAHLPLLPLLLLAPGVLVYHSLKQRIEIGHDGMRAMERMADEVDRRDPYTFKHSQRVAVYAHAIGRQLGLAPAEIELVELAAKVHDIGKIRIPDSILLKPDRLTAEERRVMETHPRLGYDILKPFSSYAKVLELVLTHHERYDGHGYPNGTVGQRLLLIAQVIPVADSLDAMTTARAYRSAKSWDSAIEELRRGAGTQWNPQVVAAAVAVFSQEVIRAAGRPSRATATA